MTDIRIRAADLEADRAALVRLLLENLTKRSSERRYCWLYLENPHGRARVWIATHRETDEIIGSGAIIPRLMHVAGELKLAAVMVDFWIRPDFRVLGPAIKLQRACIEGAASQGFAFFDLPQGNMPAVYQRMRMLGPARLTARSKPLRTEPYLRRVSSSVLITRPLSYVGDLCLKYLNATRAPSGCTIARHTGPIEDEFSELATRACRAHRICVARSAEYLRWRYFSHYHLQHEMFTARMDERLVLYAIVVDTGTSADIVDLFGEYEPRVLVALLRGIAREFRERGRASLHVALHASTTWAKLLARAGLRERTARPLVIQSFGAPSPCADWFLTYGDLDL